MPPTRPRSVLLLASAVTPACRRRRPLEQAIPRRRSVYTVLSLFNSHLCRFTGSRSLRIRASLVTLALGQINLVTSADIPKRD